MPMYSFYILPLMEKFHLDLTCFPAEQEPSAKFPGETFPLLPLVKASSLFARSGCLSDLAVLLVPLFLVKKDSFLLLQGT